MATTAQGTLDLTAAAQIVGNTRLERTDRLKALFAECGADEFAVVVDGEGFALHFHGRQCGIVVAKVGDLLELVFSDPDAEAALARKLSAAWPSAPGEEDAINQLITRKLQLDAAFT
ncbi:MAG: hypothetical protein HY397_03415 [Candidatus Doudnabacteria bacterium]|nr:hypothetical protein [Candidatus Doudnabacteria bacterium]